MRGVVVDRRAEVLAHGACLGLGRVGRAHQVAPLLDRIRRLEAQDDAGARRHEVGQPAKKRPRLVDVVETLGFGLAHVNHTHADDAEARPFNTRENLTGHALLDGIRLNDGERSLHIQLIVSETSSGPRQGPGRIAAQYLEKHRH